MFIKTVAGIALLHVLSAVSAAPRYTKSTVPSWHLPCGDILESDNTPIENLEEQFKITLDSLSLQHQLSMSDYLNRDYEYLYEKVRIGVHQHQYIPNWVPGDADVKLVKRLVKASPRMIVSYLPKLHSDLQKFAVAFEELIEDETNPKIQEALSATQNYLLMMLCEVESNLEVLPPLRVPRRIERSIMNERQRNPVDDTRRWIRDWGVVLKYRNYLHAWRHVFNY
ncbi:uncharacterized protein LOC107274436 [Cephus cinctus]|uniref:Uncharacterized protein LOC107274436 n=1 Tax=Cephus cinctus TaxID=211228 RepID=A0AAJ7CEU2_CEPCN|nr:uncharacterized protein LOC107274436 [Cephus cinctus]